MCKSLFVKTSTHTRTIPMMETCKKLYSCVKKSFCDDNATPNNVSSLVPIPYIRIYKQTCNCYLALCACSYSVTIHEKRRYNDGEIIIKPNITRLVLSSICDFSVELTMGITSLLTEFSFDEPLTLTPNIHTIVFGCRFNRLIELSKYIHTVTFGQCYTSPFILAKHLKQLHFGSKYNFPLVLSKYLVVITFGKLFNQPLLLTKHILSITTGDDYNSTIILSKKLKRLLIGHSFKCSIVLNKTIKYLVLHLQYNLHVILPPFLQHLTIITACKNIVIEHSVNRLVISCYYRSFLDDIPNGIANIVFEKTTVFSPTDNLPSKLKTIEMY